MKTYIVKTKQNIFDIALQLHGSVEGVFDLLLSNETLTFDSIISVGTKLNYHEEFIINDDVVKWFDDNNVVVRNGQKIIEAVQEGLPRMMILQYGHDCAFTFKLKSGNLVVNWDDASIPQIYTVSDGAVEAAHYYRGVSHHTIQLYGDFSFTELNLSDINGTYYLLDEVKVDNLVDNLNISELQTLFQSS